MWLFRLKWISYHFLSSIIAIALSGFLILNLYSNLLCLPADLITGLNVFGIILMVSALSSVVAEFYATKSIRKELEEVSLGAKNLAYGNLDYRLPFRGHSMIDDIVIAFNEMASRLESQVAALQKLAEENEHLLQETKVNAISEERQRLARDLHDAVSQQIFAISMLASTAEKVANTNPNKAVELISEISQSANRAQAEMRALLLQLRPLTLQNETLYEALSSLAQELESKQTIKCKLDLDQESLPKNIENQLFRIAQEGLSNVLRHANASQVLISLKVSNANRRVLLIIEDNGKGFIPEKISSSSLGIKSVKERTTLLGGTARWLSIVGQGTKLEIRVPISLDPEQED